MAFTLVTCASCGVENSPDKIVCLQCGADLGTLTLPLHLAPLLLPTPSGVTKLIAAWDGLSAESQVLILTKLRMTPRPEYLNEKVFMKALESANAYVRYLAARGLRVSGDDALRQRIEKDVDALVRYSLLESVSLFAPNMLKDADAFFALPHEARLAVVRSLIEGGEKIAKFIAHAIDHQLKEGGVSEIELYEILCDYVNKPSFREYYASRFDWPPDYGRSALENIRALWELVPKLSEAISYVLIENLPGTIRREAAIPDTVPKELNTRQLIQLLDRSDVGLEEFRKEVFWKTETNDFMTLGAAVSHNFNLSYAEFARILAKQKKERAEILDTLFSYAEDLSLYLYEAINDALFSDDNARDYPVGLGKTPAKVEARRSRLRGLQTFADHEFADLRNLGLYRLAKEATSEWRKKLRATANGGNRLKGELKFLSKLVVQGDTWQTFMAFHEAWKGGITQLSEYLPEWTGRSQDSEELLSDEGREENKIDFIAKRLLFYEEKLAGFIRDVKYVFWTGVILLAIYYGWKLLAGFF
jgi:hypothetical protein